MLHYNWIYIVKFDRDYKGMYLTNGAAFLFEVGDV